MRDVQELNSWRQVKAERRKEKNERLDNFDSTGWKQHSDIHFSKIISGSKLDYWPTTMRFRYKGKSYSCSQIQIDKFIEENTKC